MYSTPSSFAKAQVWSQSTKYLGAQIFNDLPIEVCKLCKEKNLNSI